MSLPQVDVDSVQDRARHEFIDHAYLVELAYTHRDLLASRLRRGSGKERGIPRRKGNSTGLGLSARTNTVIAAVAIFALVGLESVL